MGAGIPETGIPACSNIACSNISGVRINAAPGTSGASKASTPLDASALRGILNRVVRPARYLDNELNAVHKDHRGGFVKVLLAFPDVYDIGMSHLGLRILYHILNRRDDTLAERVFAPWVDMEREMRERGLPLYALESLVPAREFDIIGFTLQYEMSYTNILNMLDLSGLPIKASGRRDGDPLIIAGGPCAYNPEPLADIFDFFVIGEGEEVIGEIIDAYKEGRSRGRNRRDLIRAMADIPGVYVPSLYEVTYHANGTVAKVEPRVRGIPPVVQKRVVKDLDLAAFPGELVVPFLETVHDRISLEVFRGCTRGCRFCQAGMIYRPVRERSPERLRELADRLVESTGYDEISLMSLSTMDYSMIAELLRDLDERYHNRGVSVSLPSLRVDSFSVDLARDAGRDRVRKSSITFAPEAGTQRLRDVINKGVTEEDLINAVTAAFRSGWSSVKLYFMVGLPTETEEDLDGIVDISKKVLYIGRDVLKERREGRPVKVSVSASSFVPKVHTPFQWHGQPAIEELEEKQDYLKRNLRGRGLSFSWHDARTSFLEAVFSRGDRRLGEVLVRAWELGCRLDGWSEEFRFDLWLQAFREAGLDPAFYANRERPYDEVLPWDHISTGVSKGFLIRENERARAGITTPDCRVGRCEDCGVCPDLCVARRIAGRRMAGTY
ncbi:MAG: TIGR03960 family B12-binding radical SAM protein [Firmicutes bacterium]|nr:TIGR03960 family B12-binding radical SAM protein [Bacillota bacterium]